MTAIKRICFVLMMFSLVLGCAARQQNLIVDGTYKIEPIAVPNEIHVHTNEGQTEVSGKIEALANGGAEAEGMLRIEVIGLNGEVIERKEVCFSPTWEQEVTYRRMQTVYHEPQFKIIFPKIYPAGSAFRFTLVKFGEECKETSQE